jgi:DNA replication protein DnaC
MERLALLEIGQRDKACIAWAVSRFLDAASHVAWRMRYGPSRKTTMATRLRNAPTGWAAFRAFRQTPAPEFCRLITLDFLKEAANVVFVGPNGVGKSMFAQNIAHQAVIDGHTVLFTSAGQLLGNLCALDSDSTLQRRLRH